MRIRTQNRVRIGAESFYKVIDPSGTRWLRPFSRTHQSEAPHKSSAQCLLNLNISQAAWDVDQPFRIPQTGESELKRMMLTITQASRGKKRTL